MVLCGSALLAGCGGGSGSSSPNVAQADVQANITPATGAGVVGGVLGKSFDFSSGVADFGTTAPTSLTLSNNAAAPSFAIASGSDTASGVMTYGSCIFTVAESTFAADHPLAKDKRIEVTPCDLQVAAAGKPADGSSVQTTVTLVLGSTTSAPVTAVATIAPNGDVSINGSVVGSVKVDAATGAGS